MPIETLPYQPHWPVIGRELQNVSVDYTDTRVRYGRTKGPRYFEYDLEFKNRELTEFAAFQTFYRNHFPATAFNWYEPFQDVTHRCYFISSLEYTINLDGAIDYRVKIQTTVECPVITVTPPATLTGTVGVAYSQTFTSSGGAGAITFTLAAAIGNGLTLSSAGVLSGTPLTSGTFNFTVIATDSNYCTGQVNASLVISA